MTKFFDGELIAKVEMYDWFFEWYTDISRAVLEADEGVVRWTSKERGAYKVSSVWDVLKDVTAWVTDGHGYHDAKVRICRADESLLFQALLGGEDSAVWGDS